MENVLISLGVIVLGIAASIGVFIAESRKFETWTAQEVEDYANYGRWEIF